MSGGKFGISTCKAAYEGWVCEWCHSRFSLNDRLTCVECFSTPEGRKDYYQRVAVRRAQSNLAKYGVDNPSKLEEVKERIKDAFRKQDPERCATNSMHLDKYKAKHQRSIDAIDELLRPEGT